MSARRIFQFLILLIVVGTLCADTFAYRTQSKNLDALNGVGSEASNQSDSISPFPPNMELAAKTVRASTVTIRVDRPKTNLDNSKFNSNIGVTKRGTGDGDKASGRSSVAVFSGVLVNEGYVAAPLFLPNVNKPYVRITLPDGKQTIGRPRILDEYSGLAIIEIDDIEVPCLKLCDAQKPRVGSWVVSGAAWGRKEALVSIGIVSGIDFRYPADDLAPPPMIVCDLRATETSKGSGIVSAEGKLIGVVIAVSNDNRWTYAVPVCHVHNLIRNLKRLEKNTKFKPDEILVLKREIPLVGITTDCKKWNDNRKVFDCVIVELRKNGPAEKAGLKIGDKISAVDGIDVRHGFDVAGDIRNRKPGDKLRFEVIRHSKKEEFVVTLGGGFKLASERIVRLSDLNAKRADSGNSQNANTSNKEADKKTQLTSFAEKNLEPPRCFTERDIQFLIKSLNEERAQNSEFKERINELENKINLLVELMSKK